MCIRDRHEERKKRITASNFGIVMKRKKDVNTTFLKNTFRKNAQVSKYSLADLNIGNCVESTVFENKLGRFFVVKA